MVLVKEEIEHSIVEVKETMPWNSVFPVDSQGRSSRRPQAVWTLSARSNSETVSKWLFITKKPIKYDNIQSWLLKHNELFDHTLSLCTCDSLCLFSLKCTVHGDSSFNNPKSKD